MWVVGDFGCCPRSELRRLSACLALVDDATTEDAVDGVISAEKQRLVCTFDPSLPHVGVLRADRVTSHVRHDVCLGCGMWVSEPVGDLDAGAQHEGQEADLSRGDDLVADDVPSVHVVSQRGDRGPEVDGLDRDAVDFSVAQELGRGEAEADAAVLGAATHDDSSSVGGDGVAGEFALSPCGKTTEESPGARCERACGGYCRSGAVCDSAAPDLAARSRPAWPSAGLSARSLSLGAGKATALRAEAIALRADVQAREALQRAEEALADRASAGQDCEGGTALALESLDRLTDQVTSLDIKPDMGLFTRLAWAQMRDRVLDLLAAEREVLLAKTTSAGA